jgi:hypothetical protein
VLGRLFLGICSQLALRRICLADLVIFSGLAWHTDDGTLCSKFEEFGQVQEAVSTAR